MTHPRTRTNSARLELLEELRKLGVETVTAEYDGADDDGQVGSPEFGSIPVPEALAAAVEEFFYEVLEQLYGGWEDNEGAFGQFVWNVPEDRINLVNNTRVGTYETEEQQL